MPIGMFFREEGDTLARLKAQTPEYEHVRREHPAIERKRADLVRRHGARRARYWGQKRVLLQQLLTGWVVNSKRVTHQLGAWCEARPETVRAEVVASG